MIASPDRHRSRRFFGFRGVVRSLRRAAVRADEACGPPSAADAGRPRRSANTATDRALQSERARFAAKLDAEVRLACRSEAAMRRELGEAARAFVRRKAHRRTGFVRLSDYARERLGVSARSLESAAWLATRLDALLLGEGLRLVHGWRAGGARGGRRPAGRRGSRSPAVEQA